MSKPQMILIGCLTVFFVSLFIGIYLLFQMLNFHKILKKAWEESIRVLDQRRVNRKTEEKRYSALYGEMEKKHPIARLDAVLAYSGLYTRFPNLTAEKLVAVMMLEGAVLLIATWIISDSLLFAMLIVLLILYVETQVFQFCRAVRNRKINSELLHCIDLMEIHSYSTDSIVEIIRKTSMQVREPLKSELERAVDDAEFSGQVSAALRRLCNRIEHKYLKDLFLNLEICSHAKTNYKEVLSAAKKIIIQDMANIEKLRKMYQNSFLFALLLGVVGIIGLNSMLALFGGGNNALDFLWQSGEFGKMIVVYMLAVAALGLWSTGKRAFL